MAKTSWRGRQSGSSSEFSFIAVSKISSKSIFQPHITPNFIFFHHLLQLRFQQFFKSKKNRFFLPRKIIIIIVSCLWKRRILRRNRCFHYRILPKTKSMTNFSKALLWPNVVPTLQSRICLALVTNFLHLYMFVLKIWKEDIKWK